MKIPFLWRQQKTTNIDAVAYVSPRQSTLSTILEIILCKCKYPNLNYVQSFITATFVEMRFLAIWKLEVEHPPPLWHVSLCQNLTRKPLRDSMKISIYIVVQSITLVKYRINVYMKYVNARMQDDLHVRWFAKLHVRNTDHLFCCLLYRKTFDAKEPQNTPTS